MTDTAASRSTFVTVLAWLCIVMFSFGTVICILQNVMLYFMFPEMPPVPEDPQMPAAFRWMFDNFRLMFFAMLLFVAFMLVASISLLKRQDWARIAFIVALGLSIVWGFASL